MARVVLGVGTSQSPLISTEPAEWPLMLRYDETRVLYRHDGTVVPFEQLKGEVGDRYAKVKEGFDDTKQAIRAAQAKLREAIAAAKPDVIVMIADDQHELFPDANFPALSIFRGPTLANVRPRPRPDSAQWERDLWLSNAIEPARAYPAAPEFADHLITSLIEAEFDLGVATQPPEEKLGLGHAWAYVINNLLGGKPIPVVPVFVNAWYPPNVPTPGRCFRFGEALRAGIEAYPSDLRVMVVASGGLSHFIPNEELDRQTIAAVEARDVEAMSRLPREWLHSGSGQVLDWLVLSGAMADMRHQWTDYLPTYRTAAGTGIGLAFALWTPQGEA
jgi:hypothetical protein